MNRSIEFKLDEGQVAAIIQAIRQRMEVLPLSTNGNGENEYGSWVDWMGYSWLQDYLTDKLAKSLAERYARLYTRKYWAKYERAKRLVIHFVWPFKRKEVA